MQRDVPVRRPDDGLTYAGIDLGGTNIKIGLLRGRQITHTITIPTLAERGPKQALRRAAENLEIFKQSLGGAPSALAAVGVGIPGLLSGRTLVVARNLPGWEDVPICDELEGCLGVPVCLETDARAVALGEIYLGINPSVDRGVILTLGTGVGGATFERDGEWYRLCAPTSAIGLTMCHDEGGFSGVTGPCYVEDLISGSAITLRTRAYRERLGFAPPHPVDARSVFQGAACGDESCRDILDEAGYHLGLLLVNLIHIFNPQAIVIGGGVAQSGVNLLSRAREVVQKYAITILLDQVRIELSKLGSHSGICGAAFFAALMRAEIKN